MRSWVEEACRAEKSCPLAAAVVVVVVVVVDAAAVAEAAVAGVGVVAVAAVAAVGASSVQPLRQGWGGRSPLRKRHASPYSCRQN